MDFRQVKHFESFEVEVFSNGEVYAAMVFQGEDDPKIVSVEADCKHNAIEKAVKKYIGEDL
ncbi:hypothetical protein [Metabacillus sp. 84]|uniref:hypothetical protein n=1 Tax=Metabacillus sp. 84 TaxID=3404705 RepID=UPI003CF12AF9